MLDRRSLNLAALGLAAGVASPAMARPKTPSVVEPASNFLRRESGLLYRVETNAGASTQHPTVEDTVRVTAQGTLTDGTVFWASEAPVEFALTRVVAGWREGIPLMTPGDVYTFWIPPELGYGARGRPPTIPPNAVLIFKVHLLAIVPPAAPAQ